MSAFGPNRVRQFTIGDHIPASGSLADFAAFIGSEITKWGQVTQALGITLE